MARRVILVVRQALVLTFFLSLLGIAANAEGKPYLDVKNWTAAATLPGGAGMKANPEAISKNGNSLTFAGYHLGKEAQYSLSPELSKDFENKVVTFTVLLNGEFAGADSSFLAFVERASSPQTIFWNQQCYALLFKSGQIEVQKHGKGTNPNLIYRYSDFPSLGFKTFPVGKAVKISFGVVKEGPFPKMIVKLNGIDICSVSDNRYGQTVRPMPSNVIMVGVIATNKEISGDASSHSSLTLSNIEAN